MAHRSDATSVTRLRPSSKLCQKLLAVPGNLKEQLIIATRFIMISFVAFVAFMPLTAKGAAWQRAGSACGKSGPLRAAIKEERVLKASCEK
jgi:hypothetical protein